MTKNLFYFLVGLQTLFFTTVVVAQENTITETEAPREQGMMQTFIMIGIALVSFYLILWRPEQKRRKAMEQQRSTLKKGDRVTAMGIVGTVVRVDEHTIILKMYDGSKIEMLKAAITDVISGTEEDANKVEENAK